jgi:hypothetical protein
VVKPYDHTCSSRRVSNKDQGLWSVAVVDF